MKEVKLRSNEEIVFKPKNIQTVQIRILSGTVECLGRSLPTNQIFTLPTPFFLYSLNDSVLEVNNPNFSIQQTEKYYSTFFGNLKSLNLNGKERIIIVGDVDTGKSTMCTLLVNFYIEKFSKDFQTFIDFDVGQNIFVPGCVTVLRYPKSFNKNDEKRIAFFYGHTTPSRDVSLYRSLSKRVNQIVSSEKDEGIIVNTCGWVRGLGLKLVQNLITNLEISVVIVINNDFVAKRFCKSYPKLKLLHLKRNKNVQKRSKGYRKNTRVTQIKQYFTGKNGELKTFKVTKAFNEVLIFRIEKNKNLTNTALPVAKPVSVQRNVANRVNLEAIDLKFIVNSVIAVSHAKNENELINTNIFGFVMVMAVDVVQKHITFISPNEIIPSKFFILGSIQN